jgi:hypothetical protein
MSIINEALKKTQTNLDNIKERAAVPADDRISAGQRLWQRPPAQPSQTFTPEPSSAPAVTPVPETKHALPQGKPAGKRWYLIVFAEILGLGLIVWTLFIIQPRLFRSSYQPKISSPTVKPHAVITAQPAPAVAVSPETRITPAQSNLALKGIMMNQNKMVALINGGIYETGDYVDGKRISKITLDSVELLDGDAIMVLNVRGQGR